MRASLLLDLRSRRDDAAITAAATGSEEFILVYSAATIEISIR
jgi:hypothetical protein